MRPTRRKRRSNASANYSAVTFGGENAAVLIATHNREDRIVAALNSAARVVSLTNIYVVSDDSSDRTADLARGYGVHVVETFGRQGPAGAVASGLQAFRLLDEFTFIVLVDVDTRLDPRHLERVLPAFDDPEVVAVDVRVDADWRAYGRDVIASVLTAYRARAYALAHGRTRVTPGVARTYRSSALPELELDPIYQTRPRHVACCHDAIARTAVPTRFSAYRRQTTQWHTGFWQGSGLRSPAAVEVLLTSLVVTLTPFGWLVPGVHPLTIPLTVVLADYLLTLWVAIAQRRPRYLLPGLLFPLLRFTDALSLLRAIPRAWLRESRPEWFAVTEPESASTPMPAPTATRATSRRSPVLTTLSWVLLAASAALLVVRVALTTATLPPSATETSLADAAYSPQLAVTGLLRVTGLQLDTYTSVTSAFGRHASVLQAARELSVVIAAVTAIGLVAAAVILRVHPLLTALVVATLAVSGPVIALLTAVGPGVIATAWLAVATAIAAATIGWREYQWLTAAAIALLAALATAPILIIPMCVGSAVWLAGGTRKRPLLAMFVVLALGLVGVATGFWRDALLLPAGASPLDGDQRVVVLVVIAAAALGGLVSPWLRPVAAGVAAGAVLVAVVGPEADALLPPLLLATALLVAVMIQQAPREAVTVRAGAGLAGVVAVTGAVAGLLLGPRSFTPPDHASLANWMAESLDPDAKLVAAAGLWSDLDRDLSRMGRPGGSVRLAAPGSPVAPGELVIVSRVERQPGIELARFGMEAVVLTSTQVAYLDSTDRVRAGAELAQNPRLRATDEVRTALRSGRVDLRAMALLAAMCRENVISLAQTGKPAQERGSPVPDRTLTLSEVDGESVRDQKSAAHLLDWLRAQEPPFAPAAVELTPAGVTVSWQLPARLDLPPT